LRGIGLNNSPTHLNHLFCQVKRILLTKTPITKKPIPLKDIFLKKEKMTLTKIIQETIKKPALYLGVGLVCLNPLAYAQKPLEKKYTNVKLELSLQTTYTNGGKDSTLFVYEVNNNQQLQLRIPKEDAKMYEELYKDTISFKVIKGSDQIYYIDPKTIKK
jgi:hypothetical protein